jgi:nitroreductase
MEFESVIRGRRSIRAYKPDEMPEELIREIVDAARWAPSWRNTQVWNVWVLTGDALQRYKGEFRAAVERDDPAALDLPATAEWPQACSARIAATMKSRAATLEAAGEPADPAAALARMADLFGAPCLLVFGFEDCLAEGLRQLPHRLVRPERLPRRFRPRPRRLHRRHGDPLPGPAAPAAARRRGQALRGPGHARLSRGRVPGQHRRTLTRRPRRARHLGVVGPPG